MVSLHWSRPWPARGGRPPRALVDTLLGCGIAYPLVYAVANDVIAASRYDGYSRVDQAVSELSATGAPTRPLLTAMLPMFTGLTVASGVGVWNSAEDRSSLRATGALLVGFGVTGVAWVPFPMSSRQDIAAGRATSSDAGHLVLSALTVAEIVALLGVGSTVFGSRFRAYSLLSAAAVVVSGALTSMQASKLSDGEPTPGMGLYERISIGAGQLWMAVLAVILLRSRRCPRHAR